MQKQFVSSRVHTPRSCRVKRLKSRLKSEHAPQLWLKGGLSSPWMVVGWISGYHSSMSKCLWGGHPTFKLLLACLVSIGEDLFVWTSYVHFHSARTPRSCRICARSLRSSKELEPAPCQQVEGGTRAPNEGISRTSWGCAWSSQIPHDTRMTMVCSIHDVSLGGRRWTVRHTWADRSSGLDSPDAPLRGMWLKLYS